jgi:hypothetical protein
VAVVSMSKQEFSRLDVLLRVQSGRLRVSNACALIGLKRRQVFRLLRGLKQDNSPPATSHPPTLRVVPPGPQPCADYDFGRTSTRTPAADSLLAASKAEEPHEYYRSDTRPDGPWKRISGSAPPMSTGIDRRSAVRARGLSPYHFGNSSNFA